MRNVSLLAPTSASVAALLMLTSSPATAQEKERSRSGIYLTATDYKDGHLHLEGECGSKAHKLDLHHFLNRPYVDVTHDTEKRRYRKSDLFGYRACDGRDYRFAGGREYQILEARDLYIYVRETRVPAGKGSRAVRTYSFSVGPGGPLLPLTLENLKQAFPDNHRFHDTLDQMFVGGRSIEQYDAVHKMYTVNVLLSASREPER